MCERACVCVCVCVTMYLCVAHKRVDLPKERVAVSVMCQVRRHTCLDETCACVQGARLPRVLVLPPVKLLPVSLRVCCVPAVQEPPRVIVRSAELRQLLTHRVKKCKTHPALHNRHTSILLRRDDSLGVAGAAGSTERRELTEELRLGCRRALSRWGIGSRIFWR